jgi:choline dehydrogenase-like flavoprotein
VFWSLHPDDTRDLRLTVSFLAQRLGAAGMGFVRDSDAPTARAWVGGGNHHMGGLRMHESADFGVVDPFGRVHAIPNLVIASSAVFPTGCFSNPTMTVVALASRFASRLNAKAAL